MRAPSPRLPMMLSTSKSSAPFSRVTAGGGRESAGGRDGKAAWPSRYGFSLLMFSTGWICSCAGKSSSYALSLTTRLTLNGPRYLYVSFGVRFSEPSQLQMLRGEQHLITNLEGDCATMLIGVVRLTLLRLFDVLSSTSKIGMRVDGCARRLPDCSTDEGPRWPDRAAAALLDHS